MNLNNLVNTRVKSLIIQHTATERRIIDKIRRSSCYTLQQKRSNDSVSVINDNDKINLVDKPNELSHKAHKQKGMSRLIELRKKLKSDDPAAVKLSKFSAKQSTSAAEQQQTHPTSWRDILATARKFYGEEFQQEPNSEMLIDSFSRRHSYLRISLGERCNLRCLYCMPPDGVQLQPEEKLLKAHEIDRIVALFTAGGVNKVRSQSLFQPLFTLNF